MHKSGRSVEHTVFLGATAVTVAGAVLGVEGLQKVAKPLLGPALAVRVLRRRHELEPVDAALLVGALSAATVGDVFMIDPDDDARLVSGATSFAVMQAGYSTFLTRHGARPKAAAVIPRLASWAGAAGMLGARAREVAPQLGAYGLVLGTTSTLSADPALAPGSAVRAGMAVPSRDPRSRIGLGGLLFTSSDGLIVIRKIFVRGKVGRAVSEAVVLGTYAAAQFFLIEGMLALGRKGRTARLTGRA
ncbi:lysoplasmalogenase family protein [Rhodococcus sp. NPDC058521]|uniref:lysoplasmalogenase family protein n=1 Tax=Rhodococcus sp. NPDC058521 TaxID=3346536 RepID=UPI00365CBC20